MHFLSHWILMQKLLSCGDREFFFYLKMALIVCGFVYALHETDCNIHMKPPSAKD